ncbi:homocysteine S-methyltransferase family protein [Mycobacterium kansasii 824]|nr:homocysteine S-methyltransferase family protein [Mycobacterium kansasii 824]
MISDGGLATELEARGHDLTDRLWSARLLTDAPQEITAVHAAYFRAGATIATTASYQASFEGFAAHRIGHDKAVALLRRSVELAANARDEVGAAGLLVAASVGPYGAALADGSEYRGRYGLSVRALTKWHRPGWRCWPPPARTCWQWKPSPMSTRPKHSSTWCVRWACRRGSATRSREPEPEPGNRWPTRSRWPLAFRRSSRWASIAALPTMYWRQSPVPTWASR